MSLELLGGIVVALVIVGTLVYALIRRIPGTSNSSELIPNLRKG